MDDLSKFGVTKEYIISVYYPGTDSNIKGRLFH